MALDEIGEPRTVAIVRYLQLVYYNHGGTSRHGGPTDPKVFLV